MKSIGLLVAIAFSVALCIALYVGIRGMVTNPGSKGIEEPIEMTASEIDFPKDHCFHTNDNEWVYFSGIVETSGGREFGLIYTIGAAPSLTVV